MNTRRLRLVVVVAAAAVGIMTIAGCSSSGGALIGASPTPTTPTSIPTVTSTGQVVSYSGTVGTGVSVQGKTGSAPTVTIAKGAPKPTQLITSDLVMGFGDVATANSTVTVQYLGVNFTSGNTFDSSYANKPLTIGLNQVIPGWTQGIPGMKVGGVRALSIPTDLAYGNNPSDVSVAGPLVFVVELLGVS